MPTQMHVAEANYSYSGRKAIIALAPGKRPYDSTKASCRLYHEVPQELWVRFQELDQDTATGYGAASDAFFREHFEGKFEEQVLDFETYQRILILGPSQIPPRSNLPSGPLC